MRPRAVDVKILDSYQLLIKFSNGEERVFDIKPYFGHKVFDELMDENKFKTVRISGLSIEWENGADICPDELYYNSIPRSN